MDSLYLWIKALHVIAVISWMAGMLYLPRLFVYHCETDRGSDASERFKVMEKKLLRFIINPAMGVTWLAGLTMLYLNPALLSEPWMHAKLTFVVLLSAIHGFFARWMKAFQRDENQHTQKFYRMVNEGPTLLMVGIVIMVIVRPF